MSNAPSVTLEPNASNWGRMARQWHDQTAARRDWVLRGCSLAQWRSLTRRELELPEQAIIIATGHQAALWHPGILAKYIAADRLARSLGAGAAALDVIVDQDANEFGSIDVPLRDAAGRLTVQSMTLLTGRDERDERAVGSLPAVPPAALPANAAWAIEDIEVNLQRVHSALAEHAAARSAAAQVAGAVRSLRSRWVSPMPQVFAGSLMTTSIGRALIEMMHRDPRGCAGTYNAAVAAVSDAGLAPLAVGESRVELPLWRLDEVGRRTPVFAHELRSIDPAHLRPRALTMTAILRFAVADLFIHGRAGFVYDRAMERWMRSWLELPVAPMAMATADVRLPLSQTTDLSVQEAIASYRRLWHDPTRSQPSGFRPVADASHDSFMVSRNCQEAVDGPISAPKQAWLDQIRRAPRRSPARRAAFDGFQQWLAAERRRHQTAIEAARSRVEAALAGRAERAIAQRRDWAFPLYPTATLDELASLIERALSAGLGRASGQEHSLTVAAGQG